MSNKYMPFIITSTRTILFIVTSLFLVITTRTSLQDAIMWWSIICSVINIITIGFLLIICKNENKSFKELLKYKKSQISVKVILKGILITLVIGMGGMYLSGLLVYGKLPYLSTIMIEPMPFLWLAILNVLILPITTTLAEDGLYLGYALNKLHDNFNNKWICILIPAFFYALQHSFIPLVLDWKFMLYRLLSFLPLTVVYGIWYYNKRNIVPIISGHFIINLLTVLQIVMTTASPTLFDMMK